MINSDSTSRLFDDLFLFPPSSSNSNSYFDNNSSNGNGYSEGNQHGNSGDHGEGDMSWLATLSMSVAGCDQATGHLSWSQQYGDAEGK